MWGRLLLAVAIAGGIGVWMYRGDIIVAGSAQTAEMPPPALRAEDDSDLFRVRVTTRQAKPLPQYIVKRGRTRADGLVSVAAETQGRVLKRPVERGDRVAEGDILCELDPGVREALLARAKAEEARAQLDFDAATKLRGRGFESDTRVAAVKAQLDAAQAEVAAAQRELNQTIVRAPIAGTVQEPLADAGVTLLVGQVCATIVDNDPIVAIGKISERDIANVSVGRIANVELVTGERTQGTVSYIAPTADPETRTFTVEISLPNPDGRLRAGVTSTAQIPLATVNAHQLPPSALTLSDEGALGVRTIVGGNVVKFMPVKIIYQDQNGFFVHGLPDTATIITVGHEYVVDGQTVDAVHAPGERQS